jgi:hypothetical protein
VAGAGVEATTTGVAVCSVLEDFEAFLDTFFSTTTGAADSTTWGATDSVVFGLLVLAILYTI